MMQAMLKALTTSTWVIKKDTIDNTTIAGGEEVQIPTQKYTVIENKKDKLIIRTTNDKMNVTFTKFVNKVKMESPLGPLVLKKVK